MNSTMMSNIHTMTPASGGARSATAADTTGATDPARDAALSGAADGAVIGLVIGAVFAIATVWPLSLAALASGVIMGAAWGSALAYLRRP
jgi:hypothetical protein